jgi:hypothetical protein
VKVDTAIEVLSVEVAGDVAGALVRLGAFVCYLITHLLYSPNYPALVVSSGATEVSGLFSLLYAEAAADVADV